MDHRVDWDNAPHDIIWGQFSKNLNEQLLKKGWNQSELARRATKEAPENVVIGRDLISNYLNPRKKTLPLPHHLLPISKALGVEPAELLPRSTNRQTSKDFNNGSPPEFIGTGDGHFWVRIAQRMTASEAIKIMNIINNDHP